MALNPDGLISFHYGNKDGIQGQIDANTINGSDFVVTKDTDELIFIDTAKKQHTLGSSRSKESHKVNLGGETLGGLADAQMIPAGTDVDTLIKLLTEKKVNPTYIKPKCTLSVSKGQTAGEYEVGTQVQPTLTASFTQNDAGTLTNIKIINNDGHDIFAGTTSPLVHPADSFKITDGKINFTANCSYAEGIVKEDNLGNASPDGHITAGNVTSEPITYTGYRKCFYGSSAGELGSYTSELVRALAHNVKAEKKMSFSATILKGEQNLVIASPAAIGEIKSIIYTAGNDNMLDSFIKSTLSVDGATVGADAIDYNLYTYHAACPLEKAATFKIML